MIRQPWSAEERSGILATREAALCAYRRAMEQVARVPPGSDAEAELIADAEERLQEAGRAEAAYLDRIPRVVMSCCPLDGKPLVRTMDPYGLDGLWWRPGALPAELPSCPHFCGVHFGSPVEAGPRHGLPGDRRGGQTPYVLPRLLERPGVVGVLSRIELASGAPIAVVAYFAQRRPLSHERVADWRREVHLYTSALGQHRWRLEDAECDFELRPWLEQGKLRWCEPGSNNERLSLNPPETCPFLSPRAHASPACD